ncbi:MAG: type II toxin-antitoxin system VapC family toxin [Burkholderiales bacterium]|nr:type II toxin-antitoxin system VapC family toxin [Burkholderiales bacterium]MDE2566551.1 type II toxin-antitoxin system VapC family toxin [Burkholderiales bacterium]
MALADLARYDGSAGVLVDTNVWVDCIDEVSPWHDWATNQLQTCSERCPLHVNIVIYAELLIPGPDVRALDALLDVYDTLRTPLPWAAARLAAAAYATYRRRGGTKHKPLPDFFIGAHAAVANLRVLTRDPRPYKNYFARLEVVAP